MARFFNFDDLLNDPIEVDGVELDATVACGVCKDGNRYYVDCLDFDIIYVCIADHRFEFTAEEFRQKHSKLHDKFVSKLEQIACESAMNRDAA